jgi:hypothetical protein
MPIHSGQVDPRQQQTKLSPGAAEANAEKSTPP